MTDVNNQNLVVVERGGSWFSNPLAASANINFTVENTYATARNNTPISVGFVAKQGDLPVTASGAELSSSKGGTIDAQVTVLSTWPDSTAKNGILSFVQPAIAAGETVTYTWTTNKSLSGDNVSVADYIALGKTHTVEVTDGGTLYTADVASNIGTPFKVWREGPICTEWIIRAPLKTAGSVEHTYLSAWFHLELYSDNNLRISYIVENSNSFMDATNTGSFGTLPALQAYTYALKENTTTIDSGSIVSHTPWARWRKQYTTYGATLGVLSEESYKMNVIFDKADWVRSRVIASYDHTSTCDETLLSKIATDYAAEDWSPLAHGWIDTSFNSGLEGSIDWPTAVDYLLSGDVRARLGCMKTGDANASFPVCYRQDNPISGYQWDILSYTEYPFVTVRSDSQSVPYFDDTTTFMDTAHVNNFNYIAYLMTGDYYFYENEMFWSRWITNSWNPNSRNGADCLFKTQTTRAQAWAIRATSNAAFIARTGWPLQAEFENIMDANAAWNETNIWNPSGAYYNDKGVMTYWGNNEQSGFDYAGWMDNWLSASANLAHSRGHENWLGFAQWKAIFSVNTCGGTGVFCHIIGPTYRHVIRNEGVPLEVFSWSDIYTETVNQKYTGNSAAILAATCGTQDYADALNASGENGTGLLGVNEMQYSRNQTSNSYHARLKGAVAAAMELGITGAQTAWTKYLNSTAHCNWTTLGNSTEAKQAGNRYNILPYGDL